MQILTVTPLTQGILHPSLTYFSKESVSVGSIVMVAVRTREIPALVLEAREASEIKSAIKSSDFSIKKILRAKPIRIWSSDFIKSVTETSDYFVQPFGETILSLVPKTILSAYLDCTIPAPPAKIPTNTIKTANIYAIQLNTKERLADYHRFIIESFAKGQSVFICVPTENDIERIMNVLSRGIEKYSFLFHSSLTKKHSIKTWRNAVEEPHPILAIGTPQYLFLPRYFATIILEEEQSRTWKTFVPPFIDLRFFVESFARNTQSNFIIGASILRPETHARIRKKEILKWNRITKHALSNIAVTILDSKKEEQTVKEQTGRHVFQILSEGVKNIFNQSIQKNESLILVTARKGLSPITICNDCGTIIRCRECNNPLVMHKQQKNKRVYICHSCGHTAIPEEGQHETCPICGGWKLIPLGIGIERVEEEVIRFFPDIKPFIFDGDHIKTKIQAKKLISQFEAAKKETAATVLIATPMAIPYIKIADHIIVISIDSLLSIPDYRMNERIFSLILSLREKSEKTLSVQTRTDETTVIEQALNGKLSEYIKEELSLRKTFSYPPYGTILKITVRGTKDLIVKDMEYLKNFLSNYSLIIPKTMSRDTGLFNKLSKKKFGIYRMHAIIKLSQNSWPDKSITTRLRSLPKNFTIEVNPEHLL